MNPVSPSTLFNADMQVAMKKKNVDYLLPLKAVVKVIQTWFESKPTSLSEDPAHLTRLRLMAFKSSPPPHPSAPASVCCPSPSLRTTGITYLQINPCLIKHIYVSPECGNVGGDLGSVPGALGTPPLHLMRFCSSPAVTRSQADILPSISRHVIAFL